MKVTKRQVGGALEVAVKGRLDAYWADHLSRELGEVVGKGVQHLRLDLGEVDYLSSAGIRVLLKYYKQLKGSRGSLLVSNTSAPVKTVMALVGLEELLGLKGQPSPREAESSGSPGEPSRVRLLERGTALYEVFDQVAFASLACRVIGDPAGPLVHPVPEDRCRTMQFPQGTAAVGLGALGHDFQDCRSRFGPLLAVAGAVAYRPTDGTNVLDYQLQAGAFLPDAQILACLSCEGDFAHLIRFKAMPSRSLVPFSELAEACLDIARADAAGMVVVAETAGPVGSGERTPPHCLTLAVGLAAREDRQVLEPWLRPLGTKSWPTGYFHAAAFSFRPLMQGEQGEINLAATVAKLFEESTLQEILRLPSDDRRAGAEQSRFVRGACWVGPLAEIVAERPGT